ncbi:MAG: RnfABCDGE type electron transport complex subunit D [Planctomycetes bacterium]|nr:RnfABCDGE type electron transport complex subunit D [Planctomycetota bacterium]
MSDEKLLVTASPHLKGPDSTRQIMWNVVLSLLPVVAAALWYFGPSALLVILAATAGALLPERLLGNKGSLGDGSAVITGLLLGLTLPPGLPIWMAFIGGAFGIAIGKLIFGGLGQNPFNPALLGRAFLQAAFPVTLTTWPVTGGNWWNLRGDNLAWPFMSEAAERAALAAQGITLPDVATGATPLGLMKFEKTGSGFSDLMLGSTSGSLGETCALVILLCGAYLAYRGFLNWRIPASIFLTVAVFSGILHLTNAARYPDPLFMLFSGGLMLGAVYMATDMVTSPTTSLGSWLFGGGIGVLVVAIRMWGGLPEGVMYAILLMNGVVPFIERATQPRVFGRSRVKVLS